jgi:hypothetical protein
MADIFLYKFFCLWKTCVYQHHISVYCSDVLAPLIGRNPMQLPSWPVS